MKKLEKLCWYFSFCVFLILTSSSFSSIIDGSVIVLPSSSPEEPSTNNGNSVQRPGKKKYSNSDAPCPYSSQTDGAKPYSFYYPYEFEYYYPQTN